MKNNIYLRFVKNTNLNFLTKFLVVIIICMLPSLLNAQPGFDDNVEDVPVDGGLSLLVAAGVGYGAKKIREKRKSNVTI